MTDLAADLPLLPEGWSARVPGEEDVAALAALALAVRRSAHATATVDEEQVRSTVVGPGSWTRRQLVVLSPAGDVVAWASAHDRAAGRTMVELHVAPGLDEGDRLAAGLLDWLAARAGGMAAVRGLPSTQLDASPLADQQRLRDWLAAAGYARTRSWLHMTRPTADALDLPGPRERVHLRRVRMHGDGLPVAEDIQLVHVMLEESFADHFNSYRESFAEFVQRLREDPGHRWDHWWIAEVDTDDGPLPGGALVSSTLPSDADGREGSYVDYIGVHRRARGRGVAKALLHVVIRDAHERGRSRVDLEVDAESPTGADGLYRSMGWQVDHVTESWHAECPAT